MGYGGRNNYCKYYENAWDTEKTNGHYDVSIVDEQNLIDDLVNKIGFGEYKSDIRPTGPGDSHANWIWVQVKKV
jgi:hypothetical protein